MNDSNRTQPLGVDESSDGDEWTVTVTEDVAEDVAKIVAEREMLVPLLLFLVGHRPLAFVAGQFLLLCQPLGFLVPSLPVDRWSALLSHPHGPSRLEECLRTDLANPPQPHHPQT